MNVKVSATALVFFLAIAGGAQAQSTPAISSIWDDTNLSQKECNARAEQAMRNTGFRRIETIGATTFGDRETYQVGLRCLADKKIFYIFGGGPDEPVIRRFIDELKGAFQR